MKTLDRSIESAFKMLIGICVLISTIILTPLHAYAGGTYLFSVTCLQGESIVAEWKTGDIDPGKEYLRTVTGTKHPDCSIGDYNEATDGNRRKETYSHEGGVIQGIPFLGQILCGIFSC